MAATDPPLPGRRPARRWPFVVTLVLGIAIVAAPFMFQMFSRAPKGGEMINQFRPYMNRAKIGGFQRDMAEIDRAATEAREEIPGRLGLTPAEVEAEYPTYADFDHRWPAINADMTDMLGTMRTDIPKFEAVDALPPFPLFPWFFVIPGVLIAAASAWGLLRNRTGRTGFPAALVVGILGLGLIAAPAIFQMFTRAPLGGEMINDFKPLMTRARVERIQGYFLVIGAGEGVLRTAVVPAVDASVGTATSFPAITRFSADFPSISNRMAPMIGAMSDNVGNYDAVKALPPFPLFPWFFVVPGVLVAEFALVAARRTTTHPTVRTATTSDAVAVDPIPSPSGGTS